jgi:riboflavin biosynthesis pyrimidine reductase
MSPSDPPGSFGLEGGRRVHWLEPGDRVPDPLAPYAAVHRTKPDGRCWVTGHMVAGLDGTAAIGGRVGALSTPPDQALFRDMRTLADVVLVGAQTVRQEGYGQVRLRPEREASRTALGRAPTPRLAVVSRSLDLSWSSAAFSDPPSGSRTMVVTCRSAPADRLARAREVSDVLVAGESAVEPGRLLTQLAERGLRHVLCEGGPTLLGELVAAGLLDELCLTVAPVMGGDPLPVALFPPGRSLEHFALRHVLRDGETLFLRYERALDA